MEFAKVPRHCLLPVFPMKEAYPYHFATEVDAVWSGPIHWLRQFSDRLSDYVVVVNQDRELVERIEAESGKHVIPTLAIDHRGGLVESAILPSEFHPTPEQEAWIGYLTDHKDKWPWVMATNSGGWMDTNTGSHHIVRIVMEFVKRFPELADVMGYAPWDTFVAGEAGQFFGCLDQSPLLKHFRKHQSLVLIYMGLQVLYPTLEAACADGYTTGNLWLHMLKNDPNWIPKRPEFAFPYQHLQEFHRALSKEWRTPLGIQRPIEQTSYYAQPRRASCSFSGIGYYTGAARHNLSRLVDFGYSGACFFVPATIDAESERQMQLYTTDVL